MKIARGAHDAGFVLGERTCNVYLLIESCYKALLIKH
jgi:hypothetical protein